MTTDHDDIHDDSHDEFWGDQAEWPTASIPITRHERSVRRAGTVSGAAFAASNRRRRRWTTRTEQVPFTRQHRQVGPADRGTPDADDTTPTPAPSPTSTATPTPAATARSTVGTDPQVSDAVHARDELLSDDEAAAPVWDAQWVSTTGAGRAGGSGGVDPRIFRLGAVAVILTLLVPLLVGLRSDGADLESVTTAIDSTEQFEDARAGDAAADGTVVEAAAPPTVAVDATADPDPVFEPAPASSGTVASDEAEGSTGTNDDAAGSDPSPLADATITEAAAAAEQVCAIDYDVQVGDFWIHLADGAGVELAELLDANDATVDTPIYPGSTICLPAGSSVPRPPDTSGSGTPSSASSGGSTGSTPAPAPTPAPTSPPTTAAPTTAPPTTAAPTTTAPPLPPRPPTPPPAEIERIVRGVWPDDLEDRALEIVRRESNFQANVNNYCCYGLFQIYWDVHKGWLQELGVTSAYQLFDAEINARAALTLYQRSGGWGPWGG